MDAILGSIGFYPGAPVEQLQRIFDNVLWPVIDSRTQNDDVANVALFYETAAYEILIKASETEDAFRYAYDRMQPGLQTIGDHYRVNDFVSAPDPQPVVGFYLPGAAILAHTEQLLVLLRAIKALKPMPIRPVVYIGAPAAGELPNLVHKQLGFAVHFVGTPEVAGTMLPPIAMLKRLRECCTRDGVSALVQVSTPVHLVTMAAMRVAPVMLWWSMKWYSLRVDGLDERMTPRRGATVDLGGYTWRCGHVCLPVLADVNRRDQRDKLRKQWKIDDSQVAFGFFGREDKLSRQYGEAIATLLETNPNAMFVYTGRRRVPDFEEPLKNVVSRCRYVGWVDVSTCVWALDAYADSFPMGSGHTAFAAMQAGIPVVCLRTPENEQNSAGAHFMEILAGADGDEAENMLAMGPNSAHPLVNGPGEFHVVLCELAQNPSWRVRVGQMQQAFVHRFLMESEKYARQTSAIILETIARKHGIPVTALAPPATIGADGQSSLTTPLSAEEAAGAAGAPGAGSAAGGGELSQGCGEGSAHQPDGPAGGGDAQAGDPQKDH